MQNHWEYFAVRCRNRMRRFRVILTRRLMDSQAVSSQLIRAQQSMSESLAKVQCFIDNEYRDMTGRRVIVRGRHSRNRDVRHCLIRIGEWCNRYLFTSETQNSTVTAGTTCVGVRIKFTAWVFYPSLPRLPAGRYIS